MKGLEVFPAFIGAHTIKYFPSPCAQHIARCIARRDAVIIGFRGNAKRVKVPDRVILGDWCVGNQANSPALVPKSHQRLAGFLERKAPIVNHAPDGI